MSDPVLIAGRPVGSGQPCYVTAEIGLNHNGEVELAKRLIDAAKEAGCDAVKFQKRTPEACVPPEYRDVMRETPWGLITYLEYRYKVEFSDEQFREVDEYCRQVGLAWFCSCWDEESVRFMEQFDPPCYKIASAGLTDSALLRAYRQTGRPLILSTGMSTLDQIDRAVDILGRDDLIILHCTSTYPSQPEELNLRVMASLAQRYGVPVGYSGHEVGLAASLAAAALGACFIERHITLDRSMWGSDQAASVEPHGFKRLVRDIRLIETALGDGVKRVYDSEKPIIGRLRRVDE